MYLSTFIHLNIFLYVVYFCSMINYYNKIDELTDINNRSSYAYFLYLCILYAKIFIYFPAIHKQDIIFFVVYKINKYFFKHILLFATISVDDELTFKICCNFSLFL